MENLSIFSKETKSEQRDFEENTKIHKKEIDYNEKAKSLNDTFLKMKIPGNTNNY